MKPILLAALAATATATILARPAAAATATAAAPVVVELFTSQSCSSCPPADTLLSELARTRPDILALDMHVTYWDRLGWKDPYSLSAATERQRQYAGLWEADQIYTPQLVAGGRHQAIGSDRPAVIDAIAQAKADAATVPLHLGRDANGLVIDAGGGPGRGTLLLVGFDPTHTTRIGGGENGGRTLTETNIVRTLAPAGSWQGTPVSLHAAVPAGEKVALLLQGSDGRILGAAVLP